MPLEVPLYNDAEIEVVDGSLTMVVAEGDDYVVGQPASATRILTDNNDVRIVVGVAVSLGTKIESGERLDTQINLKTTSHRDEPPDQFWLSAATRQGDRKAAAVQWTGRRLHQGVPTPLGRVIRLVQRHSP